MTDEDIRNLTDEDIERLEKEAEELIRGLPRRLQRQIKTHEVVSIRLSLKLDNPAKVKKALRGRVLRHLQVDQRSEDRQKKLHEVTRSRQADKWAADVCEWLEEAIGNLEKSQWWLVRAVFWHGLSVRELSRLTNIERKKFDRELEKVIRFLRDGIMKAVHGLQAA